MTQVHALSFEFKEPIKTRDVEGFDVDPLGELTPFERGINKFMHDHDRHICIRIGNDSTIVEAFRDIIPIFFDLPRSIRALASGKPFNLELPELGQKVRFSAQVDQQVYCHLFGFDADTIKQRCLRKEDIEKAFREFISDLVRQAVNAGYVLEVDAVNFLAPLSTIVTGKDEPSAVQKRA